MRYLILSLAILLGLSSTPTLSGTISRNNPDRKHVEYGAEHKCVLRLIAFAQKDDRIEERFASCVAISPRVVLTAAHVVIGTDKCFVKTDDDKNILIDIYVFPKISIDNKKNIDRSPYDIAVCYLKEPLELDFYPELYDGHNESGKVCSISGFGVSGIHGSTKTKMDKIRRAGSNIVDGVSDGMLECSFGHGKNTELEFLINTGDSGGGLFIDQKLAGINSSIYKIENGRYDNSRHTRISMHRPWLDGIIKIMNQHDKEQ
jgi:hypothetical protein